MNSYRKKYRRFSWVMTILIVLATWLPSGWECTGAMAAVPASVAAAQSAHPAMACHGDAASLASGTDCGMPCCPRSAPSSSHRQASHQHNSSSAACMAPKSSQSDIIATDLHQPIVSVVVNVVPPMLLPEPDASVTAPAPPSLIPLPLREPIARSLASRAPPTLA